jgi:transcriptional regulator with GAF, ATPase, and Fis domain
LISLSLNWCVALVSKVELGPVSEEVWFYFCGNDRTAESVISARLAFEGVPLCSPRDGPVGHAVFCFAEINDLLWVSLREISRRARGRVLALATSASNLREGVSWRLLESGASDVLAWNEGDRAVEQIRTRLKRWRAIDELAESAASRELLVGDCGPWRALVRRIVEAAHFTSAPVLLTGESGTGKELLARLIQMVDRRAGDSRGPSRDLVTVDCSTIVSELSGSELFGHERGAFTGAVNAREGAFALADGGTLFLDEVGELPMALQAQLLRAVQEKTYKRVGGNVWQNSDFRLVCATNRDLERQVELGQFRLDLYHRIAGWVFRIPPLRERREDIMALAVHFLKAVGLRESTPEFDAPVSDYILNRAYPGNIRELRQLVQRIALRHVGPGPITVGDVPEDDRPAKGVLDCCWPDENLEKTIANAITLGAGLKEISHSTTEAAIRIAIQSENGNIQRAAKKLGVTDRALQLRRASGKISA